MGVVTCETKSEELVVILSCHMHKCKLM